MTDSKSEQYQKFKEAARKLETDQSEEHFDLLVKKIAKSPPAKGEKKDKKSE
ncbi:hypothetical protein NKH70_02085 [Mesorhizobium sp. M0991]|uniref:hypothetical protein n=1 Tax=Mesorhizobium sp. M0991 TaxID=2957043 RepID=UPI0033373F80